MRKFTYTELAYEILREFISNEDIPAAALKDIVNRSFSTFRTPGKPLTPSF